LTPFFILFHSKFEMPSYIKVVSLDKPDNSYWEILKCLGEIWRTRQKFRRTFNDIRVSVGFDRAFDQGLTMSVCWLGQGGQ
jgi:hypothetical protein